MRDKPAKTSDSIPVRHSVAKKVSPAILLLYLFGIFALPPIGYYATLLTFGIPIERSGAAVLAWIFAFLMPRHFHAAKKPIVFWQVALLAELIPIIAYLQTADRFDDPHMRLLQLAIDAVLTPLLVWNALRIARYFGRSKSRPVQPDEPRNLIHRISPEPQPEDVVNVSQK